MGSLVGIGSVLQALRENGWISESKCRSEDPEIFFASPDTELGVEIVRAAKLVCNGSDEHPPCPVRDACLEYSLEHNEQFGVWGGLDEKERRRLRRSMRQRARAEREAAPRTTKRIVVRKEVTWK